MHRSEVSHSSSSYRDLIVWQRAIELVTQIYRFTASFPDSERYGLTAQIRRAAVSVPSNVAEGQGRMSKGEFKQFLGHARGSLLEVETQITISRNLGFATTHQSEELLNRTAEVGKMLNGLVHSLQP